MNVKIENSWKKIFQSEFENKYFENLVNFLKLEYKNNICYPKGQLIFKAFNLTSFYNLKVVILGQDPYHNKNQANGLAFSVNKGMPLPPSLKNIFFELKNDLGIKKKNGDLTNWSKQGVLLLNTILTVRKNEPKSHAYKGWEMFTNQVIKKISYYKKSIVFILWGNDACKKEKLINSREHYIIKSSHPSPLSCYKSFFGSKPFSKTNIYLKYKNLVCINW